MLSIYGDESQSSKQRVFAIAGLLGSAEQWTALRKQWAERTGGRIFHAADCESGYGEYKNEPEEERHRLHRSLTRILAESGVIGWGIGMDREGSRREFPQAMRDQYFHSCFLRTVRKLAEYASQCIPQDDVEFIFDRHPETEHNTSLLYKQVVESEDWATKPRMAKELVFSSRMEIGIQAADLWARELMKRLDGELFSDRYISRIQWQSLYVTRRFGGDFLMAEHYQDLKRQMADLQIKSGVNETEYGAWLRERRLPDNQSNRILYVGYVNAKDPVKSRALID